MFNKPVLNAEDRRDFKVKADRMRQGHLEELRMERTPYSFATSIKDRTTLNPIFMGYELELCTNGLPFQHRQTIFASKGKLIEYVSCRVEGSATLGEFVTIPATLEFHREAIEQRFLVPDVTKGMLTTPANGLHIHIDRRAFNNTSLSKFVYLISSPDHKDFMLKIAGRDFYENRYCKPNRLTVVKYKNRKIRQATFGGSQVTYDEREGTNKYSAVNTSHRGTVEVRIFQATLSKKELMARLEFVDAAVRFTRKARWSNVTVDKFLEFVAERPDKYPNLLGLSCVKSQLKPKVSKRTKASA